MIEKLTKDDIGRYVRRISTGEVDKVRRDDGNGWIHPGVIYEWVAYRNDLEFVEVLTMEDMAYFNKLAEAQIDGEI